MQSSKTAHVLTDSRPCVQGYQKLCRGGFYNSAHVTTFLSMVERYQVHIGHIKGVANLPSDYTSRNASSCPDQNCQLCMLITQTEDSVVRGISVKDVLDGSARMPFTSRAAWYATQLKCPDLCRAHAHLKQGTGPPIKAQNTDTKQQHNGGQ